MASGIWPAVSGAVSKSHAIDVTANNLANSETVGFKKDQPTFREYLTKLERSDNHVDIPRGPIKDKDLYPIDGRDQSFVITDGTYTDHRQGNLRVTSRNFDFAISGKGFFEVSTPNGVRFTRQGSFNMTKDGQLVTSEGYPVLAAQPGGLAAALPVSAVQPSQGGQATQGGVAAGPDVARGPDPAVVARYINLSGYEGSLRVTEEGTIYMGDQEVAQLGITNFSNEDGLKKSGEQLFVNTDPDNKAESLEKTRVIQGMLEMSNVNPIEEMTNLIKNNRGFELDLKSIQTYDQMMGKEVNEVGKL